MVLVGIKSTINTGIYLKISNTVYIISNIYPPLIPKENSIVLVRLN